MILELCKGVHCVDLGESFQTHIFLQNLASIQPRTSPVKFRQNPHAWVYGSASGWIARASPVRGACFYWWTPRSSAPSTSRCRLLKPVERPAWQGSFSAVSKRNFASKYAFESSCRDLHNAILCTALQSQFFCQTNSQCFAEFKILKNSADHLANFQKKIAIFWQLSLFIYF